MCVCHWVDSSGYMSLCGFVGRVDVMIGHPPRTLGPLERWTGGAVGPRSRGEETREGGGGGSKEGQGA